jgi:hypothetical protein
MKQNSKNWMCYNLCTAVCFDIMYFCFYHLFTGHGIHKTTVEKGGEIGEDDTEEYFRQEGQLGDCVVNTNGSLCSELLLSFLLSTAVNENAHIGIFMDMCRTEDKVPYIIFELNNNSKK